MLLFSCNKAEKVVNVEDNMVKVTLIAGNPQVNPGTKTEIQGGNTPYWSVGDAIGVTNGTSTNREFTTAITSPAQTTEFTGTTISGDLYAYYPFSEQGVSTSGARIDLPASQNPTAVSFDGSADVLVSKMFTVDPEATSVSGLEFKRLTAVVKVVLKDNDHLLSGEHPSNVSLEAETDLIGSVRVNFANQEMTKSTSPAPSKIVSANYTASTNYEINSTNAAYLVVWPTELEAGTTLKVTASTENFAISKNITLSSPITFSAGKITTLNIGLTSANVVTSTSGLALPFEDDMAWANSGTSDGNTALAVSDLPKTASDEPMYSAATQVFKGAGGCLKFGTSSATGSITTSELDLSSAYYILVKAKTFNTDVSTLHFIVDGTELGTGFDLTSDYKNYYFNASAATAKSKVEFRIDGKRGYIQNIEIVNGTYVVPPVITVTSENPISVGNSASTQTISYNIENPATGVTLTATSDAEWISNINCSTSGTVTFDVAAQVPNSAAREGHITLSYIGAEEVIITVAQEAGVGRYTATLAISGTITEPSNFPYNLTDDKNNTWSLSAVYKNNAWITNNVTDFILVGSNSKGATSITLSSSAYNSKKIKEIHVWAAAKANSGVTTKISIDNEELGESAVLTNTISTGGTEFSVTNSSNKTGTIKIEISRPSSQNGAIYFKKLTVIYED